MDIKKALYIDFASELSKIDAVSKIACIIDDVTAEDIGLPTDVPFNVTAVEVIEGINQYTLDITHLNKPDNTVVLGEDKLLLYYDANEVIEIAKVFFEPYVDVSTVEEIYDLYDKLEELEEYNEEEVDEYDKFNPDFSPSDY